MVEQKISRKQLREEKKRFEFDPSKPRDISPGEMYRQIKVPRVEFESEEKAIVKQKLPAFVSFCKGVHKAFPSFGKGASFTPKYREAIEFLNWSLTAEEFASASKFVLFASAIIGFILAIALIISPIGKAVADYTKLAELSALFIFAPIIVAVMIIVNYVQNYPLTAARIEQYKSLTYVPEIVGYLIMSMKLVPNLEKAVEFAAQHGRGKIALELQEIIWKVQIGLYSSLAEGLDDLAYRWGKFSVEFKQALMMIRASVLENSDAKRYAVLDKTMDSVLESVRNKMEQYARDLSQPSIILFYLGVLLPLILIIVLPVGSAFSGQPLARPELLILIYNIIIPVVCIVFARNVLQRRPPTYEAPRIPKNSPLVPPQGKIPRGNSFISITLVVIIILIAGIIGSFALSNYGLSIPNLEDSKNSIVLLSSDKNLKQVLLDDGGKSEYFFEEKTSTGTRGTRLIQLISIYKGNEEEALKQLRLEKVQYFIDPKHDVTPYNLIYGLILTLSIAAFFYLYYSNIYRRKVQLDAMEMESEFKDSLYVLASRMGENKPIEEALTHAKEFLPNLKISERVFGRTVDNITIMGMPLQSAIFDPVYGSLKDNPSNIIRSSMQLVVDSVQLGVDVAARTLMSLSLQLTNSEKVSKMLSVLVSDVTSMMKTMAIFVAPVVLGITTSLQKIVMLTLGSIVGSNVSAASGLDSIAGSGLGASFSSLGSAVAINKESFALMATPAQFILIVGFYVFEIVIILIYFTTKVEEDNDVLAKINIAKALPIAAAVFVIAVILSNAIVGGFG